MLKYPEIKWHDLCNLLSEKNNKIIFSHNCGKILKMSSLGKVIWGFVILCSNLYFKFKYISNKVKRKTLTIEIKN